MHARCSRYQITQGPSPRFSQTLHDVVDPDLTHIVAVLYLMTGDFGLIPSYRLRLIEATEKRRALSDQGVKIWGLDSIATVQQLNPILRGQHGTRYRRVALTQPNTSKTIKRPIGSRMKAHWYHSRVSASGGRWISFMPL